MADHELDYESFLIENTFILTKYIYAEDFYDYLMSKHVLSSDDKELIDCRYSNPTRRQRAGKLLELLQKKGHEGFRHFMDYLEWEYSHVYEIITRKKARNPPSNYNPQTLEHKRRSRDLWLMDTLTPSLMTEQLQQCFRQNQGLQITLDEFTRVLKIGQDEKKDLEKGMENMRNKFERSEKENAELHRALSSCLKEIDQLKDDKTVLYQDTIQAQTECQNYRDRWAQVQMEKNDLIKQLQDAKDMIAEMGIAGRPHRISESSVPKLPPKPPHDVLLKAKLLKDSRLETSINAPNRSESNFQAKLSILEHDLEEEKQKNEELIEQYEKLRSELDEKEREIRKAHKNIAHHDQQIKNLQNSLDDAKVQRERYYQNILSLEEEKMKLESSRSDEHKKYREEITKTSDLFKANHQLKAELDEYKEKCYRFELKLRNSLRDSGELPSDDLSESAENILDVEDRTYHFVKNVAGGYPMMKFNTLPVTLPNTQSKQDPVISPNMKTALTEEIFVTDKHMRPLHPTDSTRVHVGSVNEKTDPEKRGHFGSYRRGYDINHPHLRQQICDVDEPQSQSSQDSLETEKENPGHNHNLFAAYEVLFPFYQDSDTGGNAVSVKVKPTALSDIKIIGGNLTGVFVCQVKGIPELKEGDKLKTIIITADGLSSRERDFEGCTLEEAYKMILQEEHYSEGYSQREVTLTIIRNEKYYRTACQWMTENNKTGDYFFVRCAQTNYGLNKGDILLIRDTRDESKNWKGYSLKKESGEKVGEECQLMNYRSAQIGIIKQPSNDDSKQRKKKAFRSRDFYERVLPMKACHKMPVKLFGHNDILDAILHIMKEDSTMFITKTASGKKHIDIADLRQDKHILISDSGDYSECTRKIQFINVYIEVDIGERKKAQILGNILNLNLQVGYADISDNAISKKDFLTRSGKSYEVLAVSNSSITDKRTLVHALESTVKKAQDQLLWLSESEMDSSEAEKYIRFLGHSMNNSSGRSSVESPPDFVYTRQESSHPP